MSTVVNSFQNEVERAPRNVTKLGEKIVFVMSVNALQLSNRRVFVKWNTLYSMTLFKTSNYGNARPFIVELKLFNEYASQTFFERKETT